MPKLLLAFIRTAHYWTEIHPELVLEDDINQLLATHEALAACFLANPTQLPENKLDRRISEDLTSLRDLKGDIESSNRTMSCLAPNIRG